MKTNQLTGAALDWAVATCQFPYASSQDIQVWVQPLPCDDETDFKFQPSTDWSQGGPIIERESISLACRPKDARGLWCAVLGPNRFLSPDFEGYGPTPLIAAMRCYVASKLGDDIDVPMELTI